MDREELLSDLKERVAEGNVVVVVGSGVSRLASNKSPSWTGLIESGIDRAAEPMLKPLLQAGVPMMLLAAEGVKTKLAPGDFRAWLQDIFRDMPIEHSEVLDALHGLGATLTTTNYDDFLSRGRGIDAVPWTNGAAVEEVLRGHRKGVVHLHGYFDVPESVVLGIRSYDEVAGDKHAQAALRAMRMLKTFLFVGCGDTLKDPNLGALMKWAEEVFVDSPYRHYRLCRTSEVGSPEGRLFALGYGDEFKDLPVFLRSLGSAAKPVAAPPKIEVALLPDPGYCFGRDVEVDAVVRALTDVPPARVPILGTGGVGKTTIALTALRDQLVAKRFGARRFFVRCDGAKTRDALVTEIAKVLEIPLRPGVERDVAARLAEGPCVLVLDNAETPWEAETLAVEELLALLSGIDSLALVMTIRGSERPGGVRWREAITPQPLTLEFARKAFLAIAGERFAADPDLDLLLEEMDRLPLAVTLLAHVAEDEVALRPLMARWKEQRTALLQRAGGMTRTTNIETSFETSLLSPRMTSAAKRLLSVLAILPAGVALDDIGEVFDGGLTAAATLRALGLILDDRGRIRMLAPLREYVAARYKPEETDQKRGVDFYLSLAADRGLEISLGQSTSVMNRIGPEAANIEIALMLGSQTGLAKSLFDAAWTWSTYVRYTGVGSRAPLKELAKLAAVSGTPAEHVAMLIGLGIIAYDRSEYAAATEYFDAALDIAESAGLRGDLGTCKQYLGELAHRRGDLPSARLLLEESLSLGRGSSRLGEANALRELASLSLESNDVEAAERYAKDAVQVYKELGSQLGLANAMQILARVSLASGEYEKAREQALEARALARLAGSHIAEATSLLILGDIEAVTDELAAVVFYWESLGHYQQAGSRRGIAAVHAELARHSTDPLESEHHRLAAQTIFREIGRDDLAKELD